MTARDSRGRFVRNPATFAERVEAEVWADLKAQVDAVRQYVPAASYQARAMYLTVAFDTAAERLEWLGVTA